MKSLGQLAFEKYKSLVKTAYDGTEIPQWENVKSHIKNAWEESSLYIYYRMYNKQTGRTKRMCQKIKEDLEKGYIIYLIVHNINYGDELKKIYFRKMIMLYLKQ